MVAVGRGERTEVQTTGVVNVLVVIRRGDLHWWRMRKRVRPEARYMRMFLCACAALRMWGC